MGQNFEEVKYKYSGVVALCGNRNKYICSYWANHNYQCCEVETDIIVYFLDVDGISVWKSSNFLGLTGPDRTFFLLYNDGEPMGAALRTMTCLTSAVKEL